MREVGCPDKFRNWAKMDLDQGGDEEPNSQSN